MITGSNQQYMSYSVTPDEGYKSNMKKNCLSENRMVNNYIYEREGSNLYQSKTKSLLSFKKKVM